MKKIIKFRISKRNRSGIIILGSITFLIIFFPRILTSLNDNNEFEVYSTASKSWEFKNEYKKRTYSKNTYPSKSKFHFNIPTKKFDPNLYQFADWKKLGLSDKQVNVILKFTKRGIYSNDDLKKIFVISDELFELIKDSTFYPIHNKIEYTSFEIKEKPKRIFVEVNTASEEELMEIKGVGNFFAKQIIKKREELGGYFVKEQLLEVWKMDQEKFDLLKDFIEVDSKKIVKISINSASLEELKKHPYFRWNIANSIVKMRDQKNGFKSIEELKESVLINEEKFEKLKPYISL